MKIAIGIEYHGAYFQGWQSQPNGRGVQDAVEHAIAMVAGEKVRMHAAGRTDSGVHALMQVGHFETTVQRPNTAWVRGTNAHLPPWVRVRWACEVAEEFHARFSARARSYQYVLYNHAVAPASQHGRVGWYHRPLDIAPMQQAAKLLLGEHDFSAFRASECQASSPIRTMHRAEVKQQGQYIVFSFQANAFLQHQIRNVVGALVYVGQGKLDISAFGALLENKNRALSPPTFMPDGLYFTGVTYDAVWQLPPCETVWD
ncbi:tRNA pseudouridine(38-40) synthase TruA [Methylophilus flavus]|jgi:tRNA pseudouridine38-40 synthase|uniref:tRNA pseudouridine synthase A n=1 Tax=Methylophilus flavus TaxID=640084 RepID=A0ABW3PBB7_9PROT